MATVKNENDLDYFWDWYIDNESKPDLMDWIIQLLPQKDFDTMIADARAELDDDEGEPE